MFFVLGKNTQIVGQEEDFWKVPVLDVNPFFFLEDKINECCSTETKSILSTYVSVLYSLQDSKWNRQISSRDRF